MVIIFEKKFKMWLMRVIIGIISISSISLMGCDSKNATKGEDENKVITAEKALENNNETDEKDLSESVDEGVEKSSNNEDNKVKAASINYDTTTRGVYILKNNF